MDYQMNPVVLNDTTFIDLSERQIKELHDKVFGETLRDPRTISMIVKLELTYIPLLIFIVVMITTINLRWNHSYNRIIKAAGPKELRSPELTEKIGMLKGQRVNILDRLFVYLTTWSFSLYLDTILMASGIINFPWVSIPVAVAIIYKKMQLLTKTSALYGVDDSDLMERLDSILENMLIKPLVGGMADKIKNIFNSKTE